MPSASSRALLSTAASASIEGNVQYLLGKVQQTDVAIFDVREETLLLLPPSWLLVVVVVVRVLLQVTVHLKISFLSSCVPLLLLPPAKVDGNEDEKELKEAPEDHAADDHRDERTYQPPGGVVDVVAANVLAAAELWGRKRNRNNPFFPCTSSTPRQQPTYLFRRAEVIIAVVCTSRGHQPGEHKGEAQHRGRQTEEWLMVVIGMLMLLLRLRLTSPTEDTNFRA